MSTILSGKVSKDIHCALCEIEMVFTGIIGAT